MAKIQLNGKKITIKKTSILNLLKNINLITKKWQLNIMERLLQK